MSYTDYNGANVVRACTRKKGYPTEAIAADVVSKIRSESPDAVVRAYGCRFCGLYHIGGSPASARSDTVSHGPNPYRRGRRSDKGYRKGERRRVRSDHDDDSLD